MSMCLLVWNESLHFLRVCVCVSEGERERVFTGLKWVPALHEYSAALPPPRSTDVSLMSACVWENELAQ